MSWREFEIFLRHHQGAYGREWLRRSQLENQPEEQRVVGAGRSDALPIDELNSWLGWDDTEGGE